MKAKWADIQHCQAERPTRIAMGMDLAMPMRQLMVEVFPQALDLQVLLYRIQGL